MNEITRIAIDTSKSVFTLHGTDASGRAVLRRNLRRQEMVPFFARRPPLEVVLEACGGSHHWGRTLVGLGHQVRLIPPQYVKPFVKRGKNDRNDAEAISEAAARPDMREVAVKSAEQQAQAMLLSVRELLVRQRTQLVNALRGHAAEFGHVSRLGREGVATVLADVAEDAALPIPRPKTPWRCWARRSAGWGRSWPRSTRSWWRNISRRQPAGCWRRCRGSGRSVR